MPESACEPPLYSLSYCAGEACLTCASKQRDVHMICLAGPDLTPITDLILTWTHIGQAMVGSIGALAFVFALLCAAIALLSQRQLTRTVTLQRYPCWQWPPPFAEHCCSTALSVA